MKKGPKIWLFLLVFAAFFSLPSIFMFGSFTSHFKYQGILANGVSTEATIIVGSYSSNVEVNDVDYYSIEFEFSDEDGQKHRGRTSPAFTYYEIKQLESAGTIIIKYDPNTFEAIEATYSLSAGGNSGTIIIFSIFTVIDLILWGVTIAMIVKEIKKKKIAKDGHEYTAAFVSCAVGVTVNGVPHYYISYSWTDHNGNFREGKSGSDYTYREAKAFEMSQNFQIKATGDDSVIITSPAQLMHNISQTNPDFQTNWSQQLANHSQPSTPKKVQCRYCDCVYDSSLDRCPNCGAAREV